MKKLHRYDSDLESSTILRKRGFLWYGDEAVAFAWGDGTVSLLLPRKVLALYPYYSASYEGFAFLKFGGVDNIQLVLRHWAHQVFGREMPDYDVVKAKEVEKVMFGSTFTAVSTRGDGSEQSPDTLKFLKATRLVTRREILSVEKTYCPGKWTPHGPNAIDVVRNRRTTFCSSLSVDVESIRWYMKETGQKKFFITRTLSMPTSITTGNPSKRAGKIPRTRNTICQNVAVPTYIRDCTRKDDAGVLIQYGSFDGIEKQWFVPGSFWMFPEQSSFMTTLYCEDDVYQYCDHVEDGIFESLDRRALLCGTDVDMEPSGLESVLLVNSALEGIERRRLRKFTQPLVEMLINERDPIEVMDESERECMPIPIRGADSSIDKCVQADIRCAVEFASCMWLEDKPLCGFWRKSAPLITLGDTDRWGSR